ncbi:hypothetical protein ACSDQ9_12445 [Aestuariimicrobium soli]|uniref:hypothetical protein n=1 Tax=Aestuariimicrobium soli TaxID=2035834 RepID=UPI003EB73918
MKVIKVVLAALGVIGLGFAIYWFVNGWVQLDRIITAVHVTDPGMDSPRPEYNAAVVFAFAGALVLGLALGLPSQLASRARKQALRDVNERVTALGKDDDETSRRDRDTSHDELDKPLNER